jgi:hypothetical protein
VPDAIGARDAPNTVIVKRKAAAKPTNAWARHPPRATDCADIRSSRPQHYLVVCAHNRLFPLDLPFCLAQHNDIINVILWQGNASRGTFANFGEFKT